MKALIIVFSPSGNTYRIGELLQASLEQKNISTKLHGITGDYLMKKSGMKKDIRKLSSTKAHV